MLQKVSRSREKGLESSNASRVLVKELKKRQSGLKEFKESKSEMSELSIDLDDDAFAKDECRSPLLEALLCSDKSTSSLNYNKKSDRLALRESAASAILKNPPTSTYNQSMISPASCFSFSGGSRNMVIPYDSSSEISSISHTYSQSRGGNQANVQSLSHKQKKSSSDRYKAHKGDKGANTNVIGENGALNEKHHRLPDSRSVSIDSGVHLKQKRSSRRSSQKNKEKSTMMDDQVNTNMNVIDDGHSMGSVAASQKTMQTSTSMKDVTTTIIAPNVDKLSSNSVVEILLRNKEELVSIHCSVDVLKMRSQFFYTVLSEQDMHSTTLNSEMSTEDSQRSHMHRLTSRIPIEINDDTPFECLAFLECLHDGRNVTSNGEWSYNWARLAVVWKVLDMVSEYAQIIDNYLRDLLTKIEKNSWRCNSNVLSGYQAVVFQKQAFSTPKFHHGTIVEMKHVDPIYGVVHLHMDKASIDSIGKDPLHPQVATISMSSTTATATFSSPTSPGYVANSSHDSPVMIDTSNALLSPGVQSNVAVTDDFQARPASHPTHSSPQKYDLATSYSTTTETIYTEDYIPAATTSNDSVGGEDVKRNSVLVTIDTSLSSEYSLFVRKEGINWIEPDTLNLAESEVTQLERSTFWEMIRSIIELPTLAQQCMGRVCNQDDITAVLKKPEFKVLWPNSVPNFLPKRCALELIEVAYANDSF